jgi:hypothetical protein
MNQIRLARREIAGKALRTWVVALCVLQVARSALGTTTQVWTPEDALALISITLAVMLAAYRISQKDLAKPCGNECRDPPRESGPNLHQSVSRPMPNQA